MIIFDSINRWQRLLCFIYSNTASKRLCIIKVGMWRKGNSFEFLKNNTSPSEYEFLWKRLYGSIQYHEIEVLIGRGKIQVEFQNCKEHNDNVEHLYKAHDKTMVQLLKAMYIILIKGLQKRSK